MKKAIVVILARNMLRQHHIPENIISLLNGREDKILCIKSSRAYNLKSKMVFTLACECLLDLLHNPTKYQNMSKHQEVMACMGSTAVPMKIQ